MLQYRYVTMGCVAHIGQGPPPASAAYCLRYEVCRSNIGHIRTLCRVTCGRACPASKAIRAVAVGWCHSMLALRRLLHPNHHVVINHSSVRLRRVPALSARLFCMQSLRLSVINVMVAPDRPLESSRARYPSYTPLKLDRAESSACM